jgi:hypothetical protein
MPLCECIRWHGFASDIADLAQAKRDFKLFDSINKSARRLGHLLRKDDLIRLEIATELSGGMAALEAVVPGLIAITDRLGSLGPYSEDREAEIERHLIAAIDERQGTPRS